MTSFACAELAIAMVKRLGKLGTEFGEKGNIRIGGPMDRSFRCTLFVFLLISTPLLGQQQESQIDIHEAKILVYLVPDAKLARADGVDVEIHAYEKADSPYYWCFLYSTRKPVVKGQSVTLGHYRVNKYSADIWRDVPKALMESREIQGVQRILRQAHGISDATVKRFRALYREDEINEE